MTTAALPRPVLTASGARGLALVASPEPEPPNPPCDPGRGTELPALLLQLRRGAAPTSRCPDRGRPRRAQRGWGRHRHARRSPLGLGRSARAPECPETSTHQRQGRRAACRPASLTYWCGSESSGRTRWRWAGSSGAANGVCEHSVEETQDKQSRGRPVPVTLPLAPGGLGPARPRPPNSLSALTPSALQG